jgi:phage gpG-like protein
MDKGDLASSIENGAPKGLWKVLLAIQNQAMRLVPVHTGKLKQSISVATYNANVGDSDLQRPSNKYHGVVGSNLEYAAAVEYGRPDMKEYPMQPYLRPAAQVIKAKLRGEFTEELNKSIREMARVRRENTARRNK